MKLTVLASWDDPRFQGGVCTFIRNLSLYFYKEDIKVIVEKSLISKKIYKFDENKILEVGSSNIFYRIVNKLLKNNLRIYKTRKYLKQEKPDIIILNYIKQEPMIKNLKGKKILVQHMDYDTYIKRYCNDSKEYLKEILEKKIDVFVCLSEYDRERFIKELKIIDQKKIKAIRHISNLEILKNKKEKTKKLIIISRIAPQKRLDLAILAMRKLKDFTLEIYGENWGGNEKRRLEKIILEKKIDNVFFKGVTNQVKEKLEENGIFIMTSDFEGYPITTIEAMRRGLPIILRNTFDSAPDIVQNNGVLLEKEWNEDKFVEAIHKIYDNYEIYSKNSIEMGKRHNFEMIKKQWEDLVNELLGKMILNKKVL